MGKYTVKQLAELAGVSVRTLHLYDKLGLLQPSTRTESRYRLYEEKELLRLQQILFYKELGFPLQEIKSIMDDPDFDVLHALQSHKEALKQRSERLLVLMGTIDKTILKLKGETMIKDEELYEGLSQEKATAYRKEAIEKYGEDTVKRSENFLKSLGKEGLEKLKSDSKDIREKLYVLRNEDPSNSNVQEQIARLYENIRMFWGTAGLADKQKEAFKGLGQLYVNDDRFTMIDDQPQPEFANLLCKAMEYYADQNL
jgi:DNA-binding transcriptional MerR regulator